MAQAADLRTPNVELVALREDAGLSQEDLAEALNELAYRRFGRRVDVTKKTVGRWERGEVVWPQPFHRRLLAECFQVAVDELGFFGDVAQRAVDAGGGRHGHDQRPLARRECGVAFPGRSRARGR